MITRQDYFQKPHSQAQDFNCDDLLTKVNALGNEAVREGAFEWKIDPDTGSCISGSKGGDGDGGFRTPGTRTGAPQSKHRNADAVDVYDPGDKLDTWLDGFETGDGMNSMLAKHGLYREDPAKTQGSTPDKSWCHLQRVPPGSGKNTYPI